MNDRTLLELAARAAGMQINEQRQAERDSIVDPAKASLWIVDGCTAWNPLIESHHAFILAVQLRLDITFYNGFQEVAADPSNGDGMNPCQEVFTENPYAATRRAIVRAAAEIGKSMGGGE
ncbi:TPA: hypothetical protein ACGJ7L_003759 [Pseudomonas aeruginosa]|uniref:Uncharacterized protein n=7 Tax=Pseudomonas aeruginosa TaxID=287 RepID=A0A9P1R533_PSEAI|nr:MULTISPECIES: hypothetical protein [Pseudomonas]CDI90187.1 hypothetical protein BN889_02129 [Pseudomonas aeruginosa PA38182]AKE70333.1 hypothetical protein YQ19_19590 [Pseudomonas aeruginosa]ARG50651.1 hypothetical protein BFV99_15360 [Pseudomonas aeruginosa]EIU2683154.1 hypothetical protein [Pseudomonas aeruginosa]EIU3428084.1 hypothetical protein [Pseudomonas aeruginosa]